MTIYLDNNATTPVAPTVLEAMLPFFTTRWGNPSSVYPFGNQLGQDIGRARSQVAALLGSPRPAEICFTSGGTEANHMAIRGALFAHPQKRHIITSVVEHSSVLNLCRQLETQGYSVTYLPVDATGQISINQLENSITDTTALVSIMWANNETGILSPIEKIAEVCARKGVLFHSDAVQAVGKIPIAIDTLPVNLLSIAGHKIHGPKGVGALYIRRGTKWVSPSPGTQENGRHAGTENVAGIVGLGMAAEHAHHHALHGAAAVTQLRTAMEDALLQRIPDTTVNGRGVARLGNTTSINIKGVTGETLVMLLAHTHDICVSTGSACSAGHVAASHVIAALGVDMAAYSPIRLSLSEHTSQQDVNALIQALPQVVAQLRAQNPNN